MEPFYRVEAIGVRTSLVTAAPTGPVRAFPMRQDDRASRFSRILAKGEGMPVERGEYAGFSAAGRVVPGW